MKTTAKMRKMFDKTLYSVESVPLGFRYWRTKLLNYTLGIFKWEGLPDSIPWRELELNLQITGHAVICRNSRTGELVVPITELYGFDEYYRPTGATFGNVLIPFKRLELGINAGIIYNDRISGNILMEQNPDSGLLTFISRYARMLADIESSIDMSLINNRVRSYMIAGSIPMAERLKDFQNKIALGERGIITDDDILEAFRTVDVNATAQTDGINDLLIARDKILSMFYRDIGIKFQQEQKRAQVTEDEVQADDQLLLINIEDLLQARQEALPELARLFDEMSGVTVEINKARIRKDGMKNDNL